MKTTYWIVGGAIVLLAIVVGIILYMRKKRRETESLQKGQQQKPGVYVPTPAELGINILPAANGTTKPTAFVPAPRPTIQVEDKVVEEAPEIVFSK